MRDLDCIINRFPRRKRSAHQPIAESAPLQQFRYQVRRSLMRANIKDGENTGMIQRAGGASLLFKPAQTIKIAT
jgi:hypothetical protein